jgi:hypothetical protein
VTSIAPPLALATKIAGFEAEFVLALTAIAPLLLATSMVVPDTERARIVVPVPVVERSAALPLTAWDNNAVPFVDEAKTPVMVLAEPTV